MSLLDILLVLFSLDIRTTRAATSADLVTASKDNSPDCTCYEISSDSSPAYFTYHRFYDWRNLASSPDQFASIPPRLEEDEDQGSEELAEIYQDVLNGTEWNQDWGIMSWGKEATAEAPVRVQNSAANVYIGTSSSVAQCQTSNGMLGTDLRLPTPQHSATPPQPAPPPPTPQPPPKTPSPTTPTSPCAPTATPPSNPPPSSRTSRRTSSTPPSASARASPATRVRWPASSPSSTTPTSRTSKS